LADSRSFTMSKVNVEKNISPTRAQRVAQDGNLRSGIVRDYYVVDEGLLRDGVIGCFVRRNKEPGSFSTVFLDEDAMALFLPGWREVVRKGRYLDANLS